MRVWFNGRTEAFQASDAGSIPVTRSIESAQVRLMIRLACLLYRHFGTWRSLVARLLWEQDVAGSNPVVPTSRGCGSMVELKPSKLLTRVRFPSPAPLKPQVRALSALTFFVCGPSCGPNAGQIGKKLQTLLFRALHTGSCLLGRAPAFNCASDPPKAITGRSYILMRACDCSFSSMTLSREQRA